MSTLSTERPQSTTGPTKRRESASGPPVNHYVKKSAILGGIVNDTPATALCGDVFVPRSMGAGRVDTMNTARPLL